MKKIIKQVGNDLVRRCFPVEEFITNSFGKSRKFQLGSFDGEFFMKLFTEKQWIDTEHIETCLRGLELIMKQDVGSFSPDIVFSSVYFEQCAKKGLTQSSMDEAAWKTVESFATATRRGFAGLPWKNAKQVYFPVFLPGHWVCAKADFHLEDITVYDCNMSINTDQSIADRIAPFKFIIPKLLFNLGMKSEISDLWSHSRCKDFPQNDRGGDCGIYTVKAIEVGLRNGDFSEINDKEISRYRGHLAASVFYSNWVI